MTGTGLPRPTTSSRKKSKIFVIVFVLLAVFSAIYAAVVFKQMVDDEELQEKLEEVRSADR